jgi:hypothetical protein
LEFVHRKKEGKTTECLRWIALEMCMGGEQRNQDI